MRTILVSEPVWQAIANRGKFGETEDDVLRREFKLPANPNPIDTSSVPARQRVDVKHVTTGPRKRFATRRMSSYVSDNQLRVAFHDGPFCSWLLPSRDDKSGIREVRDKAVAFALQNGASIGQKFAVMKALTDAGFHLTK
jgi:hypothetical protein